MHAKCEIAISYGLKMIANVKFNNRRKKNQTGQKKKHYATIIQPGDMRLQILS